MRTALPPHKHCLYWKHSLTPPPIEAFEPEFEVVPSSLPLSFPKPMSHPKHAINHAPVVDMISHSTILPSKKSKTIAATQLCGSSSLSEVSPSGMFFFLFWFLSIDPFYVSRLQYCLFLWSSSWAPLSRPYSSSVCTSLSQGVGKSLIF